ncbi:hypothetical protein D3C74_421620 [compost metagenome]
MIFPAIDIDATSRVAIIGQVSSIGGIVIGRNIVYFVASYNAVPSLIVRVVLRRTLVPDQINTNIVGIMDDIVLYGKGIDIAVDCK